MTVADVQPFGDRILVRPDARPEMEGVIHIPQSVTADNPNFYSMTGVVVTLGTGSREDVYECCNRQCRYESRRTVGERCPICGATQLLARADGDVHQFDLKVGDRVLFGRFAGRQVQMADKERLLVMREVEVLAVVDGAEDIRPGYQPAQWNRPTKGVTPVQEIR